MWNSASVAERDFHTGGEFEKLTPGAGRKLNFEMHMKVHSKREHPLNLRHFRSAKSNVPATSAANFRQLSVFHITGKVARPYNSC